MDFEEIMLKYSFALKMLETKVDILLQNYSHEIKYNKVEHVKSRLKSKESICKKLSKKGYELTKENLLNNIHDVIGIRIVCSFLSDVYDVVNLIKNSNEFIIKEEKDYIKNPKKTGYISYHIIVSVPINLDNETKYVDAEIQIRTLAMDFWASLDHKMQYKAGENIPTELRQEIYDCSKKITKMDEEMNELNEVLKKYKDSF